MIKMQYIKDTDTKYVSCLSCGKRFIEDSNMIELDFRTRYGMSHIINLCSKCKKQLKEIIND